MLGHLVIAVCCITAVMPVPTRIYDQRQTGDLNVQIELKDLQVVALLDSELLEDYTNYDYFYDYADFTIKPVSSEPSITSTTTKTTEKNDIAEVTEPSIISSSFISTFIDIINSTAHNATSLNDEETSIADPSNGTVNSMSNADESQSSEKDGESGTVVIVPSTTVKSVYALRSQKRCKSGYTPNGNGRCRRANRRWLSLLSL